MSIIQKLENSYLGILRVVVIVAASILLIVAVVIGSFSLNGMLPSSEPKLDTVIVDPKDVLAKVAPDEKKKASESEQKATKKSEAVKEVYAYQAEFEKIYATAEPFVKKYSKNTESISKESLFSYLDKKTKPYESDDLKVKYISGLVDAVGTSLQDVRVIARVEKIELPAAIVPIAVVEQTDENGDLIPTPAVIQEKPFKESPINVVEEVVTVYTKMFDQKLENAKEKQGAEALGQMQAKADSTMQMYVAAGLFGFFLLVVFLSIIIKIERNLREIAVKP